MSARQRETNRPHSATSGETPNNRSTALAAASPAVDGPPGTDGAGDRTKDDASRSAVGPTAAGGPADASLLVVAGQFHIQSRKPILLLTALALLLSSLSFPPVGAWWLGYVCLAPWLVCVCTALPSRRVYAASYLLGVAFYAANVSWLYAVTPPGYVALCLWFALSFVFPAWAVRHMFRRYSAPVALTFPLAWIAFEYLRGLTLAGFPWLYLGHTQYRNVTLIQVSDLVGVHGVSFFVAMVNGWLTDLLIQPILISSRGRSLRATRLALGTALTALIAAFMLTYGVIRLSETESATRPGPSIAVIQQDFPATVSRESVDQADPFMMLRGYVALARRAAARSPDLIVMPETAWVAELNREFLDASTDDLEAIRQRRYPKWTIQDLERQRKVLRETSDAIHALAAETGATVVIGAHATEWREKEIPPRVERFNSAYVFPPNATRYSGRYDKMHLVLFGEFVPFRYSGLHSVYEWLNSLTPWGAEGIEYSLGFGEQARRFQAAAPSQGGRTYRFSTPICYEDVVTGVIRRFVGGGAEKQIDFLLNLSNDGWFHHSSELEQHLAACVFRAVEYRVPVARSVNTGISAFVDSSGQIHHRVRATRDDAASFDRMRQALEELLHIVEPAARRADESPGGAELDRDAWQAAWTHINERFADEIRQATQSRWDEFMKGASSDDSPSAERRPTGENVTATQAAPTTAEAQAPTQPARRDESEFDYLRIRLREKLEKVAMAPAEARSEAWSELVEQILADRRTLARWTRKPETAPGLRIATIRSDSRHTFYAQMGDVFAWGCVAACGLMLTNWLVVRLRRPSRRQRRKREGKSKVEMKSRNEEASKRRNVETKGKGTWDSR